MDSQVSAALKWYAQMAAIPGWKAQAWHSVQELAREYPAVFGKLPDLLTAEMRQVKEQA